MNELEDLGELFVFEDDETLAKDYLDTANGALALAQRENFANPQILEQAASCLMRALELKPDYIEALLAVAYLSALLGLKERAEDALNQAQNISPKEPRIPVLRKSLQQYFEKVPSEPSSQVALADVLADQLSINLNSERIRQTDQSLSSQMSFLKTNF